MIPKSGNRFSEKILLKEEMTRHVRLQSGLSDVSADRRLGGDVRGRRLSAVLQQMFAEGVYLLFYNMASYRHNINRRLKVMDDKPDRESVLVQLRRERGLTSGGEYRLPLVSFNKLV